MENDDIVATLCIIIIANAVKIIEKKEDRDVGDNGPDLGYKGEVNMEPIMLYCKS